MLDEPNRTCLLDVAEDAIRGGLGEAISPAVDATEFPAPLRLRRATFVTLHKAGDLRGCIGSLEAVRALVEDAARNAYAAAFRDPRFAPLIAAEWAQLTIDISVLSTPEPLVCRSESQLIGQLRPFVDGLILEYGVSRGTFLPAVWTSLPDPKDFLQHLKHKAGLSAHGWPATLRAFRYTTQTFGRSVRPQLSSSA